MKPGQGVQIHSAGDGFCRVMEPIAPEEDDFISQMPDNVITNILDRLDLEFVVRTGVLSKTWRFKWTLLSQLVFNGDFFFGPECTDAKDGQHRVIISRFFFHLRGAITKFYLTVFPDSDIEDEDINHWILFLSRNGIKDLTIKLIELGTFKLPTHFFSCLELKHLQLHNCFCNPPPNFHGFPNILSLDLDLEYEDRCHYCELITQCPLLEILILRYPTSCEDIVADIATLENLKILSLYLCDLDIHSLNTTFELLGSLPKLQELDLIVDRWKVIEGSFKQRLSTAFPSLKTLKLSEICLDDGMKVSCVFELIRSCLNLQTLEITAIYPDAGQFSQIHYKTTGQLQLRSVMFKFLKGSENELCLLKYILACSPFLKKIVIQHPIIETSDEKLKFALKLLKLHRASPDVDFDVGLF